MVPSRPSRKKQEIPDYGTQIPKLRKVSGQLDGIGKMINQNRYCPQIINQIRAARAALLAIESSILETHLKECVTDAIRSRSVSAGKKKVEELMTLFTKASSKGVRI